MPIDPSPAAKSSATINAHPSCPSAATPTTCVLPNNVQLQSISMLMQLCLVGGLPLAGWSATLLPLINQQA